MLKQLEGARLGLFVFVGTILLVIAIFLVGNKDSLFVSSIHIKTNFTTVEGLKTGAPVRLSGLDIGSVSNILLTANDTNRVEVTMRIEENMVNFIRLDSWASIETEGVIGKKIISITPGTEQTAMITEGSFIKSKNPVNLAAIIAETRGVIGYTNDLTRDFSEIVYKVNHGQGTIGKLINDDELYNSAVKITQSADTSLNIMTNRLNEVSSFVIEMGTGFNTIISNVDSAVADVNILLDHVRNGEGVLGALIADRSAYDSIKIVIQKLARTAESARLGTNSFVENMEALKHNWLFKGYFEERGYWDRNEYETNIDSKLLEIKKQNLELQNKIDQLKSLQEKINSGNKN